MSARRQNDSILLSLSAIGVAQSGWFETSQFGGMTIQVRTTATAAISAGALTVRGTNNAPQDPVTTESIILCTSLTPGTAYSTSTGTLSLVTGAGGTANYVLSLRANGFPKFVAVEVNSLAGGGTFSLNVTAAGWSN